jgi:hypothetical protein
MLKNIVALLMLLCIIYMVAPAGAVNSNNKDLHCDKLSITGLKLHEVTETTPIKVGFIGYVTGPVSKVKYTVTNPSTDAEICNCSSFCPHCIKLGECICTCGIQTPGIYDVSMTAYDPNKYYVNKVLKNVSINH